MSTRRGKRRGTGRWQAGRWLPPVAPAAVLLMAWYAGESGSLPHSFQAIQATNTSSQLATVGTDVLNVRSGPSTGEPVVATANEGDQLEITGPAVAGFLPVRSDAVNGWMAAEYLQVDGQEDTGNRGGVPVALAGELPEESTELDAPTVVPPEDPSPVDQLEDSQADVPVPADAERWILIDRSDATVTLHAGDRVVGLFPGRIGRDPSADGFYSTAVGSYRVYDMHQGLSPTPFAEDTYLTDWVGFDPVRKNGIHSPARERDGTVRDWQNPTTLGCVRLSETDAETVYAFAEIGMRVEVVE